MLFVQRLSIEGFKSFLKVDLKCRSKNVILGPNGSGKSSLIEVFDIVHRVLMSSDERFYLRGNDERYHHHGPKETPRIHFDLTFEGFSYALRFESEHGRSVLDAQRISTPGGGGGWQRPGRPDLTTNISPEVAQEIQQAFDSLARLVAPHHFHDTSETARVRRSGKVEDNRVLRGDGSNLAAVLYLLSRTHQRHYRRIVETVRQVAPWFQDFVLEPRREEPEEIQLEWRHRDSDNYFDAFSLSDGSLRFICLCTLLLQPTPPPLILLDEPELGLHPAALCLLGEMLTTVEAQLFVATQSPSLVSYFSPDDVVVTDMTAGRTSKLERLESANLIDWLERYSLGELWEKNVIGGRP